MKNDQRRPDDRIGHEAGCQSYGFRAAQLQAQIDHPHLKLFLFPQNAKIQFQFLIFRDLHLGFLLKTRVLSSPHYRQVGYLFLAQPYLSLLLLRQACQRHQQFELLVRVVLHLIRCVLLFLS